ncbi:MAG: c-type cytochrome domain-containing protein [Pseudomonadota bacterium]
MNLLPILLLLALLAACTPSEPFDAELAARADETEEETEDTLEPKLESIQKHVFDPHCIACHAGSTAEQGMRLDSAGNSYYALVNVRSNQNLLQDRVEPGDADNSYLIDKLEGTQLSGEQMPKDSNPLDAETIAVIRQWIDDGAPPPNPDDDEE